MRAPEKILIVRFSSIGDLVLASPLLRVLRAAFPAAQIDFLTKAAYADLVRFNPNISSVQQLRSGERAELKLLRAWIRDQEYDLLLDLHNSLRSRYLKLFSGTRAVRSVNKRVVRRFLLVNLKRNTYRHIVPVADRYLETVRDLGLRDDGRGLELFVPEDTAAAVGARLGAFTQGKRVIGLVPSARHFTKRWPQERFVELGIRLAKEGGTAFLVFGGPGDVEPCADVAQLINGSVFRDAARSLAGQLTLLETASAFDFCSAVVTNDTGLMHIAAARRRPLVAVFGSTVEEFGFFPCGEESRVVERKGLPCRPCSPIGRSSCPEGHFKCMQEISAGMVLEALASVTRKPERTP